MFAVPGWNVSASVKTQVEAPKPKDPSKPGKKAQKRKEKQQEQINEENLAEHWDKVANGKTTQSHTISKPAADGLDVTDEASQEKRGKKRKRGKAGGNKGRQEAGDGPKETEPNSIAVAKHRKAAAEEPVVEKSATADSESKRDKKKRKKESKADRKLATNVTDATATVVPPAAVNLMPEPTGLTALQRSMRSKLASARFRHLNESLYTKPSADSASIFKKDPSMFEDYHRGFAQQVEVWPSNPVDGYVHSIITRGKLRPKEDKKRFQKKGPRRGPGFEEEQEKDEEATIIPPRGDAKPLPRNPKGQCTIADLGCGTASLSYRLQSELHPLNLTLHSFDLCKPTGPSADLVTVTDISALPLPDASVDIAIFCLALMGTNWLDFIDEAYRVLRWRGELWVSEIKSRFGRPDGKTRERNIPMNSIGSLRKTQLPSSKKHAKSTDQPEKEGLVRPADEALLAVSVDGAAAAKDDATDVSAFVDVLRSRGFVLDALPERQRDAVDMGNKMFVKMAFVKAVHPNKGKNAKADQRAGAVAQRGGGLKFGLKGKRFRGGDDEGEGDERDGAVLKPCLYKI
ncbi:hypothetical protein BDW02DRAFT_570784, partial [Decorospora gaudefroyi]